MPGRRFGWSIRRKLANEDHLPQSQRCATHGRREQKSAGARSRRWARCIAGTCRTDSPRARSSAGAEGEVAVSIFVNPLQFEPGSDFSRYPRPEAADEELCRDEGVDLLFRPVPDEMYSPIARRFVEETALSERLCGASRPGHFRGVCTVVAKLFHLLAPDAAVFGEKDFQQLAIIRRMVRDLNFPIEIIAGPTVREAGRTRAQLAQSIPERGRAGAGAGHSRRRLLAAAQFGEKQSRANDLDRGARDDRIGAPRPDRLCRNRGRGRPATAPNDRARTRSSRSRFFSARLG